jgi:hypothetical protein
MRSIEKNRPFAAHFQMTSCVPDHGSHSTMSRPVPQLDIIRRFELRHG